MSKLWVKFGGNNAVKVSTEGCELVDDFIKAVKKKMTHQLGQYDSDQISISLTAGGAVLRPDLILNEISALPEYIGNDDEHPLCVGVLRAEVGKSIGSSSESSVKAPHRKRKKRWEKLNEILEKNKKKSKYDSTGYSYVKWATLKSVLQTTPYIQPLKHIPDREFNILSQYLSFAAKCFGPITTGNGSQRLYLIAPIIICVCILFNGDVQIIVDEDLEGNFLKAREHFEFILCRGNKRVCIVEAKRDNMGKGMAKDLIGCEVAAELYHLDKVCGIVTNYVQWNFLRSLDEKIELEECAMDFNVNGPVEDSLKKITAKIYSMLSDE
jgi:hypothetical protein